MDHDDAVAPLATSDAGDHSVGVRPDEREASDVGEEIRDPVLENFRARAIEPVSRWKIAAAVGAVLLIVVGAVFGWAARSRASTLPALDEAAVRALQTELDEMNALPAHRRRALAGRALASIEQGRLPARLLRALEESGTMTEWERRKRLQEALLDAETVPLWRPLCPATVDVEAALSERRSGAELYRTCGLHRLPLLSASQVVTSPGEDVLMAHVIFVYLDERAALTDTEARALRAMAQGTVEAAPALPFR